MLIISTVEQNNVMNNNIIKELFINGRILLID